MKELVLIQNKLNAPKGQRNTFGKYNYRSAEDILEALKPLLFENECFLNISDNIEMIGDRFYVKATAKITNKEGAFVEATAYAREELTKKGMDASQITGSTSSYARKYALNGLFAIDDNKDADTDEFCKRTEVTAQDAISEIHKCKTRDEANKVWNKYKQFQKDKTFLAALKAVVDKIDKK